MPKKKVGAKKKAVEEKEEEEDGTDESSTGEQEETTVKEKKPKKKVGGGGGGGKRRALGKNTVVTFMSTLIHAGYLGEELPEASGDQHRAAQRIRQMAEKLARQALRHGEEDVAVGEEEEEE
jgi:hypothetical protein